MTEMSDHEILLNLLVEEMGSPGLVVDEARALISPCTCYKIAPTRTMCWSSGVIGTLTKEQEERFCPTKEYKTSPKLERRMANWMEAVEICKAEIAELPKGERLDLWLSCMGRELGKRSIEV